MEPLRSASYVADMIDTQNQANTVSANHRPDRDAVIKALTKRSYAVLGTVSPAGHPHAAGVLYQAVGTTLYTSTLLSSRKARNIAANPRVGVTIPVRRLPVGPPSAIQFQGTASIVPLDDPELRRLADGGQLDAVTGHGELEMENGCFLRIEPTRRLHTFGLGMSLLAFIKDPLNAGGVVELAG
jgi:hypothetical protein